LRNILSEHSNFSSVANSARCNLNLSMPEDWTCELELISDVE